MCHFGLHLWPMILQVNSTTIRLTFIIHQPSRFNSCFSSSAICLCVTFTIRNSTSSHPVQSCNPIAQYSRYSGSNSIRAFVHLYCTLIFSPLSLLAGCYTSPSKENIRCDYLFRASNITLIASSFICRVSCSSWLIPFFLIDLAIAFAMCDNLSVSMSP